MTTRIWYSGLNNYRKHTIEFGSENHVFTTELLDVETENFNTVQEALANNLRGANLPVEVLYSGGLDSEWVIVSCLQHKIPVVAVTLRLLFDGGPINIHDLYYAEKFCREHNVTHRILDLEITKFFENGDHIPLMEPYKFTMFSNATILWLITQCNSFPVVGGDYTWPQVHTKLYSPHRYDYNAFEWFMRDRGITGIGNMLSHSLESNTFFIKEHMKIHSVDPDISNGWVGIRNLKDKLTSNLNFGPLTSRHRSYGWEMMLLNKDHYNMERFTSQLVSMYGKTTSNIKWNNSLGELIGSGPGSNNCYVVDPDDYPLKDSPQP